ncbi:MAG TPA: hypothetical protein VFG79_01625 [Solirubrobacter sp.]|nr:hypothetical protein [Solirubrobacter sp.]
MVARSAAGEAPAGGGESPRLKLSRAPVGSAVDYTPFTAEDAPVDFGGAAPALAPQLPPGPPSLARAALAAAPPVPARSAAAPAAHERPRLSLVQPEPEPEPEATPPRLARSAAERLADRTGGAVEEGEGGLRTVHFPAPGATATSMPTISREIVIGSARQRARPAQETAPAATANGSEPAPQGDAKPVDKEELYEYFLDRFKRDLLVEREQLGHLIIDNP